MLRRGGSRLLGAALQQVRGYAADAALATEGQEFLRFGSPFAQQLNLAPALATLPETKVGPRGGDGPQMVGVWPRLHSPNAGPVPPPPPPLRPNSAAAACCRTGITRSLCPAAGHPPVQRPARGLGARAPL